MKALLIDVDGRKTLHIGTTVPNFPHFNIYNGKVKIIKQFEFDDLYCLINNVEKNQ